MTQSDRNDASVSRRDILALGAGAISLAATPARAAPASTATSPGKIGGATPAGRPPRSARGFTSVAVERTISAVDRKLGPSQAARQLSTMFAQCFPNTLDTTVRAGSRNGKPDTFVITGDIPAMWLRDSAAQVWPYLPLAREDPALRSMVEGVIHRQARCVLIDPYANAFSPDETLVRRIDEGTEMRPGVFERKFEVDSLCYVLRLAHGYWKATGDLAPFDAQWRAATVSILQTFRTMQRTRDPGPYRFQRSTRYPSDTAAYHGRGMPTRATGMIASVFRPSDDGCVFPFLVPSNMFAVVALKGLAELARAVGALAVAADAASLAQEVDAGVQAHGIVDHALGKVFAYEVDGYGGRLLCDDANAPSLLALPYFGCCSTRDPIYRTTRRLALSDANPWYFAGRVAAGIGSPHTGDRRVWPIALIMQALTSIDRGEILKILRQLIATTAGTGFMHEAFDADDSTQFSRPWFAWANTLFGELILHLVNSHQGALAEL